MKILALHSNFIEFEAKKKGIKEPEELKNKKEKISDCLVVFMSVEERDEKNLNIMSKNPVFLARIHLRRMELAKVTQLLFDFDLSPVEVEYILRFVETMMKREEGRDEIERNRSKLESLLDSFQFYIFLLNKNDVEIKNMIGRVEDQTSLASYNTLVAKLKSFYQDGEDHLLFTEYENLLFEKKDQI